jgi:hypothetical protein
MLYDLFDIPEETSSSVLASMPSAFTIVTLSVAESADWSKVVSFVEQCISSLLMSCSRSTRVHALQVGCHLAFLADKMR